MKKEEIIEGLKTSRDFPDFCVGDTVRTHVKIREGEKERIQVFEGTVIKKRRGTKGASFTVRKVSYGVGVERIFPMESSAVEKVEVVMRGKVRRARLFYLRKRRGKGSQVQERTEPVASKSVKPAKEVSAPVMKSQSVATAQ